MTTHPLSKLFGGDNTDAPKDATAPAQATPTPRQQQDDDDEPDGYRPCLIRGPRPSFSVVEAGGKRHGFGYHALRHPVHEVVQGDEYLSFLADGCAVTMQGRGLLPIFHGMLRHTLWELRCHDGKQKMFDDQTRGMIITRLEVVEPQERLEQMRRNV